MEGYNHGLGYLLNAAGERVAAPVVAAEFLQLEGESAALRGARVVALDFDPEPGYWSSQAALESGTKEGKKEKDWVARGERRV